jgi:predicted RNA-binding Zn ribbon-like protein
MGKAQVGSTDSDLPAKARLANEPVREDLAIRFVNTAAWRLRDPVEERISDAEQLLAWLGKNRVVRTGSLGVLRAAWREDPAAARAIHARAIALREAIYALLVARMKGAPPVPGALALFNEILTQAGTGARIAWKSRAPSWEVSPEANGLNLFKPIVVSAAELVTGPRAERIKQCEDDRGCGWLFVDESRAQNRRWCAMGDCGNRAKARRHYHRAKSSNRH